MSWRTFSLTEEIKYLKRDNKVLCENLTNREFQIISLCGIVGIDAEEHLEAAVKELIAKNKQLINDKFEFANEEQAEEAYWSAADEEIEILRAENEKLQEKLVLAMSQNYCTICGNILDGYGYVPPDNECKWKSNPGHDYWDTGCGHAYTIIDGAPKDNRVIFCPYCGKIIYEVEN